jgi:signal transduction histidine kinase
VGEGNDARWYRVSLRRYPVKDQSHLVAYHEEITEQRQLEAQLRQQALQMQRAAQAARGIREDEQRWKLALEVNHVGVWDFDALARTVVGSRRWKDVWDISEDDAAPRRSGIPLPTHRIHPNELPQFLHDWYELLADQRAALEVGINVLVGDDYRYMRLRGRVVQRDDSGTAVRVVGTLVDIHDARRHQREAANLNRLQSVGELAAGIAHEINTPTQYVSDNVRFLNDVFGNLADSLGELQTLLDQRGETIPVASLRECLAKADLPYLREEIPKAMSRALDGVQRVAKIVSAMREFSHPGQEQTPTDLNQSILNAVTIATNEWKYVAKLDTDLDSSLPRVPVVPGEFGQVILNLLVNAAQAIGEVQGQRPERLGTIRIISRRLPDWAEVTIADDGCGIPNAIQDKIFDPFFTTKPVGKGTGQGLAIAHNFIVRHHGGSISVQSEPGSGTTFTIRVPLEGLTQAEKNRAKAVAGQN